VTAIYLEDVVKGSGRLWVSHLLRVRRKFNGSDWFLEVEMMKYNSHAKIY
jgi:hypothetical protein